MLKAEIHTEKGVMAVQFYEQDAPNTVANFCKTLSFGILQWVNLSSRYS